MRILGLVLALTFGLSACNGDAKPAAVVTVTAPASSSTPSEAVASSATPEAEPYRYHPSREDFKVKLRITRKQCFGSAGCNVSYQAVLSWVGPTAASKLDHAYDLTYKVMGDESGPILDTIHIQPNRRYTIPDEGDAGTRSSTTALTASVVRLTRGY